MENQRQSAPLPQAAIGQYCDDRREGRRLLSTTRSELLSLLRGTLVLTSSTTPMSMAHKCTNARMGGALRQRATPFSSGPCGSHHSNQGRNRGRGPVLRLLVRAHRVESDEVARAFGVSNHTPRQIDLLKTAVSQPIVANQLQLSITHALIVAQGVAANMHGLDQSVTVDGGGILDYCRINGITVQA